MKTAFLLLGAQRSGTSVTSHMLSQFDVSFGNPTHFLQAEHNPIFFELKWVNQFNDRVIQSLGYTYTDCFLPLEADYDRADILELEQQLPALIQREWNDAPIIGLKDPRFSFTFPIWERALLGQGYRLNIIFVFRHPTAFLRSNQKLFHNWEGWDEERHLQLWLRMTLAAIYFTRHHRIFYVNYDELMAQPLTVAKRLATFFHLDEQKAEVAATVVDPTYQHHKEFPETGNPTIEHYYHLLCQHHLGATDYLSYRDAALAELNRG